VNIHKHKCVQCPFSTPHKSQFENHCQLHLEGASATVCPECYWYVRPSSLNSHIAVRHKTRVMESNAKPGKKLNHPTLEFANGQRGKLQATTSSNECSFGSSNSAQANAHLSIHQQATLPLLNGADNNNSTGKQVAINPSSNSPEESFNPTRVVLSGGGRKERKQKVPVPVSRNAFLNALCLEWKKYKSK